MYICIKHSNTFDKYLCTVLVLLVPQPTTGHTCEWLIIVKNTISIIPVLHYGERRNLHIIGELHANQPCFDGGIHIVLVDACRFSFIRPSLKTNTARTINGIGPKPLLIVTYIKTSYSLSTIALSIKCSSPRYTYTTYSGICGECGAAAHPLTTTA